MLLKLCCTALGVCALLHLGANPEWTTFAIVASFLFGVLTTIE